MEIIQLKKLEVLVHQQKKSSEKIFKILNNRTRIAENYSNALRKQHRRTRMHCHTDLKEKVIDQTIWTETPTSPLAVIISSRQSVLRVQVDPQYSV